MQRLPGLSSSRLPTVLTAVAAALAVIGAAVAVTGAAEDKDTTGISNRSAGRTTTTDGSGDLGGGDGGDVAPIPGAVTPTTSGGSGGRSSTTARSGATQPGTSADACAAPPATNAALPAPAPPATGTYDYISCADADKETDETTVADKPGDPRRRLITTTVGGSEQTKTEFYGPNGIFQESFTIGGVVTCDWNPDILEFPPSINVGSSWSANSKCTITSPQGSGTIEIAASAKVTGKVAFPVDGTPVNAWAIESNAHVTISGRDQRGETQKIEYDIISRLFYAPAQGIDVYRHIEVKTKDGGSTTVIDRLKSLTPTKK